MIAIIILTGILFIVFVFGKAVGDNTENNNNTIIKKPVSNKNVDMLIDFATLMAKHIQNNLQIDSPLVFYEQVYLLYFLRDMYAVGKKISETSRHKILNDLIITLEYRHKLDYLDNKNDFKNTFSKRYENYMYILLHDKYNFSDNFFDEVFEYQTAQISSIKNKNQFSNFDPETTCLENNKEELHIKSIVSDNFKLIDAFMSQQ